MLKTRIVVGLAAFAVTVVAQQAGPFTAAQSAAGRTAYQTNCASCHAPDLSGREGPQLAGANFITQWGSKTASDLIGYMRAAMPPGLGGSLPEQIYVNLGAFILESNGAKAGKASLAAK